jgi:hypothetical protein
MDLVALLWLSSVLKNENSQAEKEIVIKLQQNY